MSAPSRRERFRPLELLSLGGIVGVFVGLIVLMSTREFALAGIFAVVSFIVALVVLAMLALATPTSGDEKIDLDEQDRDAGPKGAGH